MPISALNVVRDHYEHKQVEEGFLCTYRIK